jgi:hypothetical protein
VEAKSLFELIDPAVDAEAVISAQGNPIIQGYRCPSDPWENAGSPPSNYAVSLGAQAMPDQGGQCGNAYPGNFFGNGPVGHGSTEDGMQISGVFSRYSWSAKLSDVTDGTANTIAMGEILPKCGDHHQGGWRNANALWTATTAPINYPTCPGEGSRGSTARRPARRAATVMRFGRRRKASSRSTPAAPSSCSATARCTS